MRLVRCVLLVASATIAAVISAILDPLAAQQQRPAEPGPLHLLHP